MEQIEEIKNFISAARVMAEGGRADREDLYWADIAVIDHEEEDGCEGVTRTRASIASKRKSWLQENLTGVSEV